MARSHLTIRLSEAALTRITAVRDTHEVTMSEAIRAVLVAGFDNPKKISEVIQTIKEAK